MIMVRMRPEATLKPFYPRFLGWCVKWGADPSGVFFTPDVFESYVDASVRIYVEPFCAKTDIDWLGVTTNWEIVQMPKLKLEDLA